MLGEQEPGSPIDPQRKWFDPRLVAVATQFWRKLFNRPEPVQKTRPAPSADDIAHVEECCRQTRANLAAWSERNKSAFAERAPATFVEDNADIAALQRKLGIVATKEP